MDLYMRQNEPICQSVTLTQGSKSANTFCLSVLQHPVVFLSNEICNTSAQKTIFGLIIKGHINSRDCGWGNTFVKSFGQNMANHAKTLLIIKC